MAASAAFLAHVEEMLEPLGALAIRRMFGGAGVFVPGPDKPVMMALIADDVLYLKADETNRGAFEAAGKGPFVYEAPGGKRAVMSYYEVPDGLLEDGEALIALALQARKVALAAAPAKGRRLRRP